MIVMNETPFVTGWTVGFQPDGREVVVLAVKATYRLRLGNRPEPRLADEQQPLLEADEFGVDPACDAPVSENDFALFKPSCDILVSAKAYSPREKFVTRVEVGVLVGAWRKVFAVVGKRHWRKSMIGTSMTAPEPFQCQKITYDVAFGGTDVDPTEPSRVQTYLENPVGQGFCHFKANLEGLALPLTEEAAKPVSDPTGEYQPMAFGPVGRNWFPRFKYGGTYDEAWLQEKIPFLPDDFDYRYFQAAPLDQQIAYPAGGEPIVLANLTQEGRLESRVPTESIFVSFVRKRGESSDIQANLDTILIDAENDRLCLTWRAVCPLHRDPFELREMVVERACDRTPGKVRARMRGKKYMDTIGDAERRRREGLAKLHD
jgi:hypothetical protein